MNTIDVLIPLIFERFSAFQTLWSLYIAILLGVVGFVASATKAMQSNTVKTIITVGFLGFASVNYLALEDVREQRVILIELAVESFEENSDPRIMSLIERGRPTDRHQLALFHWLSNTVVIVLIWLLPSILKRTKQAQTANNPE